MISQSSNSTKAIVNHFRNPRLGRRTGQDVRAGKNIRKGKDGLENFDDYFTDEESATSDMGRTANDLSQIIPRYSRRMSSFEPVGEPNESTSVSAPERRFRDSLVADNGRDLSGNDVGSAKRLTSTPKTSVEFSKANDIAGEVAKDKTSAVEDKSDDEFDVILPQNKIIFSLRKFENSMNPFSKSSEEQLESGKMMESRRPDKTATNRRQQESSLENENQQADQVEWLDGDAVIEEMESEDHELDDPSHIAVIEEENVTLNDNDNDNANVRTKNSPIKTITHPKLRKKKSPVKEITPPKMRKKKTPPELQKKKSPIKKITPPELRKKKSPIKNITHQESGKKHKKITTENKSLRPKQSDQQVAKIPNSSEVIEEENLETNSGGNPRGKKRKSSEKITKPRKLQKKSDNKTNENISLKRKESNVDNQEVMSKSNNISGNANQVVQQNGAECSDGEISGILEDCDVEEYVERAKTSVSPKKRIRNRRDKENVPDVASKIAPSGNKKNSKRNVQKDKSVESVRKPRKSTLTKGTVNKKDKKAKPGKVLNVRKKRNLSPTPNNESKIDTTRKRLSFAEDASNSNSDDNAQKNERNNKSISQKKGKTLVNNNTRKTPPKAQQKTSIKKRRVPALSKKNVLTNGDRKFLLDKIREAPVLIKPDIENNDGLRRSNRIRVQPLEIWRNERLQYERKGNERIVTGIYSPLPDLPPLFNDYFKSKIKRRNMKTDFDGENAQEPKTTNNHSSLELPLEDMVDVPAQPLLVLNAELNQDVYIDLVGKVASRNFQGPDGEIATSEDPYIMCLVTSQKTFAQGHLVLRPQAEKPMQYVKDFTLLFYVANGKLLVTVHCTSFVAETGDTFFVPIGNKYSVKNLKIKKEAHLSFTQVFR